MNIKYPKVYAESKRVYISFYINKKRYRLSNGKRIGSDIDPNSFPENERFKVGKLLAAEAYKFRAVLGILYLIFYLYHYYYFVRR